jgi:hypothetical protein
MKEDRGSWYLLTAIIIGVGLGLLYSWIISPAEYINTPPSSLKDEFKEEYRSSISAAYGATGNLQRAEARLQLLGDEDPSLALVIQAQRYLADGSEVENAKSLADLASALGQVPTPLPSATEVKQVVDTETATFIPSDTLSPSPSISSTPIPTNQSTSLITNTEVFTSTAEPTSRPTNTSTLSVTPGPSPTPTPTFTPLPSTTPTATLAPPFILVNHLSICDSAIGESQIQIYLSNAAGIGVPGIEVIVFWDDGENHFFTGLKPDIDDGYADYVMDPGIIYSLKVGLGGELVKGIVSPTCSDESGNEYWGSMRFVFSNP